MNSQETIITLSISQTGTPHERSVLFNVLVDGETVVINQGLSPTDWRAMCELSQRYNAMFEQHDQRTGITAENLRALGVELFNLWLERTWDRIMARVPVGNRCLLVIASDVADVLNLPWEILIPAGRDFIGFDPKFGIRRLPWSDRSPAPVAGALPPRPLRILFMACAPQDQPPLDYEREEEFLLQAISRAGPNVAFDSGDLGTFEELRERINGFQPHIVHLTGHGIVGDDGLGYFAFEDEHGDSDLRSSMEIRQRLFGGSGVQCAFISGCQSGKAPEVAVLGGVCQGLVGEEVPLAIGWASSIADDIATRFATTFYNTLAAGQPVDRALLQARQAIRKECEERGDLSWTLPALYAATTQSLVFDPNPARPPVPPPHPSVVQQPLPGMKEGYAEHFVDRRRELQRLLPALREGALQVLIITGIGGAGKSALATRLARKLEVDGFTLIPVPSSKETPLSVARLLQICGDVFLSSGLREAHATLRDASLPADDRVRYIVSVLNRGRFVLVLDNFEVNIEESSRRILDPTLADFYSHLLTGLAGGSRAIITCIYRPADVIQREAKSE